MRWLHKASKLAALVVVYTKIPGQFLKAHWQKIHNAAALECTQR